MVSVTRAIMTTAIAAVMIMIGPPWIVAGLVVATGRNHENDEFDREIDHHDLHHGNNDDDNNDDDVASNDTMPPPLAKGE